MDEQSLLFIHNSANSVEKNSNWLPALVISVYLVSVSVCRRQLILNHHSGNNKSGRENNRKTAQK